MKQSIGEFLATLRRANGYTQQEVADKFGISNRTLSSWECGTTMPDILLLPALADLYGVTADEILRGERGENVQKPSVTRKSMENIYKSKYARFTMWAYILCGILCLGLLLFYIGMHVNIMTIAWVGWRWWLFLLYLGLIVAVACAVLLFAVWRSYENAADDEADSYRLSLRLCISSCMLVVCIVAIILMCVSISLLTYPYGDEGILPFIVFLLIAAASLIFAIIARHTAYKKWGSEEQHAKIKKNNAFLKKYSLYCLIPIGLSIVAMVLFSLWWPTSIDVLYSNTDAEQFVRYLQTARLDEHDEIIVGDDYVEFDDEELYIDFQAYADGATPWEHITVADGIEVSFPDEGDFCWLYLRTGGPEEDPTFQAILVDKYTTADGSLSAYNLRFNAYFDIGLGGMAQGTTYHNGSEIRYEGGEYRFVDVYYHNYQEMACGFGGILIGLTVFSVLIVYFVLQLKLKK